VLRYVRIVEKCANRCLAARRGSTSRTPQRRVCEAARDPQVNSVRACSACSGDYEDPEETAWTEMGEEDAGEADAENAEQPEVRE
jgi:hypothetical protein